MAFDRIQADDTTRPGNTNRLFHIVDPNLRDVVGHYFEYDRTVAEGAAAIGYTPVIMANHAVEAAIARQVGAHAVFRRDIWGLASQGGGLVGRAIGRLRDNARFLLDLRRALRRFGLTPGSVVFAHTFIDRQILGLALLPFIARRARHVRFVYLLRYQPDFYVGPISRIAFRLIEWSARFRHVHLTTDSARLGEQLGRLTDRPVHVLPIPHVPPDIPDSRDDNDPATTCFVSLGNARDEKGILEILDAIRILHQRGEAEGLRFVLQCNDAAPDIQAAIDAFRAEAIPGCELLPDKLESDTYYAILRAADVVLLPYWRSIYFARTSGVFMESLSAGKPVIATADTWMSDQLEQVGGGLVVADRSAEALADAILRSASRRDALSAKARGDRDQWRALHNPRALVAAIDALDDAPRPPAVPPANVLILYPHDDIFGRQSGSSRRVNLLADFLVANGMRVRLLHDHGSARIVLNGVTLESLEPQRRRLVRRLWVALTVFVLSLGRGMRHRWMFWQYTRTASDVDLERWLRQHVRWADVVILEYPFWAATIARICGQERRPLVITAHDVLSDQLRGLAPLHALGWAKERRAWRLADRLIAVSKDDQDRMRGLGLEAALAPNPTDGRLFEVDRLVDARRILADLFDVSLPADRFCLFVGSRFDPNVRAVEAIRQIASHLPDLGFVIAGACAEPERSGNVLALGRVADTVLLLLHAACDIVLVPIPYGTGASLKTVEGLAAGRVVLGTSAAFRGLDVVSDGHAVIEDSIDAYPERIRAVLADHDRARAMGQAAREFARSYDSRVAYLPYLPVLGVPTTRPTELPRSSGMIDPVLIELAQLALRADRRDIAEALIREVRVTSPTAPSVMGLLAAELDDSQAGAGGHQHVDSSDVATRPEWAWTRELEDTWTRFANHDYATVIDRAVAALQSNDRRADAHFLLAQSLHNGGIDPVRALFHYDMALRMGYSRFWGRLGRGRLRREQGRYAEALHDLAWAGLLAPVHGSMIGVAKETALAFVGLLGVRRRAPRSSTIPAERRRMLWQAYHDGAFAQVTTLLDSAPETDSDAELQFILALSLHDSGLDAARADRCYQRAQALGWDASWVGLCRGRLHREAGRSWQAVKLLVPALLRRPNRRSALSCARQIALAVRHWNQVERRPAG